MDKEIKGKLERIVPLHEEMPVAGDGEYRGVLVFETRKDASREGAHRYRIHEAPGGYAKLKWAIGEVVIDGDKRDSATSETGKSVHKKGPAAQRHRVFGGAFRLRGGRRQRKGHGRGVC